MTFAEYAPEYIARGIPCFPVDQSKIPMVKNWQNAGVPAARKWVPKFYDANIGMCCGAKTGITEVDIDQPGDEAIADAMNIFGITPVIIQTASGNSKLWYGYNGEKRSIRPFPGLDIDILGNGLTVAPPSISEGRNYEFIKGGLDDLDHLPYIDSRAALYNTELSVNTDGLVRVGIRDDVLFRRLLREVRHVDDENALRDVAHTINEQEFVEPLPDTQVEQKVQRALFLESTGCNFVSIPRVSLTHKEHDTLLDAPDAVSLLMLLRRNHSNRDQFAISPKAMSGTVLPGWSVSRIKRARDVLYKRDFIERKSNDNGNGKAIQWKFG